MRTREDLFSFSVWSEYSVVKKSARWSTTEHTEYTEWKPGNEDWGGPVLFFRVVRVFRGKKSARWSTTEHTEHTEMKTRA